MINQYTFFTRYNNVSFKRLLYMELVLNFLFCGLVYNKFLPSIFYLFHYSPFLTSGLFNHNSICLFFLKTFLCFIIGIINLFFSSGFYLVFYLWYTFVFIYNSNGFSAFSIHYSHIISKCLSIDIKKFLR